MPTNPDHDAQFVGMQHEASMHGWRPHPRYRRDEDSDSWIGTKLSYPGDPDFQFHKMEMVHPDYPGAQLFVSGHQGWYHSDSRGYGMGKGKTDVSLRQYLRNYHGAPHRAPDSLQTFDESRYKYLYHGTSDVHLDDILQNGIRPGRRHSDTDLKLSGSNVYLTTDLVHARSEAASTAHGGEKGPGVGGRPVVLAIHRDHPSVKGLKLDPEYDYEGEPSFTPSGRMWWRGKTAFATPNHIPPEAISHVVNETAATPMFQKGIGLAKASSLAHSLKAPKMTSPKIGGNMPKLGKAGSSFAEDLIQQVAEGRSPEEVVQEMFGNDVAAMQDVAHEMAPGMYVGIKGPVHNGIHVVDQVYPSGHIRIKGTAGRTITIPMSDLDGHEVRHLRTFV